MKERGGERKLSSKMQINDAFYGGQGHRGKRGPGSENKAPLSRLHQKIMKATPSI